MYKAIELAGEIENGRLPREYETQWQANNRWLQSCKDAAAELRRLAAMEQAIKDAQPVAWESFCVLDQKARYSNLPIQSLQPGVYKHTPLYTLKGIKP